MKGVGLLIAAAVLQLCGAAMGLLGALPLLVGAGMGGAVAPRLIIGFANLAIAAFMIVVSIFLLYRRRWAWIASLTAMSLLAVMFLVGMVLVFTLRPPYAAVGFGELIIILGLWAVPVFVTIGLLIGARHAVARSRAAG